MPRQTRQQSQSEIYHLIIRRINKQLVFEDEVNIAPQVRFVSTCKGSGY